MQTGMITLNELENYRLKEAYGTLRTNIDFCGNNIKTIAVTSCLSNEGKSSIAVNLAISIAMTGKSVILIDADLRKSVLLGRYKGQNINYGLTHYLVGRADFGDIICTTNHANLFMIFSGPVPPNPSELVGSEAFKNMLQCSRATFDYVIVDTPPLGSVIDAAIVAHECDGTIMVLESKAINYRFAQQMKNQLIKAECKILGAVLNKVNMRNNPYYGKYYGKYYGNNKRKHSGKCETNALEQ